MSQATDTLQIDAAALSAAAAATFAAAGCTADEAPKVAHALVEANLFGAPGSRCASSPTTAR